MVNLYEEVKTQTTEPLSLNHAICYIATSTAKVKVGFKCLYPHLVLQKYLDRFSRELRKFSQKVWDSRA